MAQCVKEYEAVMVIESFMFLLGWDIQVPVERKWEAEEEDKANFHQPPEKKDIEQTEREHMVQEHVEQKKENETKTGRIRKVEPSGISGERNAKTFETSPNQHTKSVKDKAKTKEDAGKSSNKLAGAASERRQRRRASDGNKIQEEKKEKKTLEKRPEIVKGVEEITMQADPNREVMFLTQMNLGMRREVKWAKKGNADSQQKLGSFYAEEGTKHLDYKEAVYWYKLSAAQGNYKAQLELGRIFDSGKVQEDGIQSTGIYWYRRLAEEGFPTAQCILGAKYLWGDGVEEDKKEAVQWLKKAAAQGYKEAQGYLSGVFNL